MTFIFFPLIHTNTTFTLYRHNTNFTGRPIISVKVDNQRLLEGDTVIITCQAIGTPIPSISWYFNGAPVDKENTVKYMISETSLNPTTKNTSLTIRSVYLSDNGTYTCNATSLGFSEASTGILTVYGKLHYIYYI